ncbi:Gfo/Idh/MocA family protein [Ovoidimarina sediminis]|uniref:Gfo/Idh/MocA family protein n=1 Tax=Ovoidimarina sediminis TaxID=3079856 RepID=UPI00290900C8|nr:Gfo/Idh/MocA family oxidoreductase [Rhodophyticola sp. MJ-SS7]MDU8945502.1 Gfo/Idh/MocA family oxidoreductase [Rhodophyticola sp. MJ-SS7]
MKLRVGLFGCGRIASHFHAPILSQLPDVELTALVDIDPENRGRLVHLAPGAMQYSDWRRALEIGALDAAVICLPPALHAPVACAAFDASCAVYVEKPLALSLEDGRSMIRRWRQSGKTGMVGFNFRFHPHYLQAVGMLRSGHLGEVCAVRSVMTSAKRALPGWKAKKNSGGDALLDLAIHHVDIIGFLTDSRWQVDSLHSVSTQKDCGSVAILSGALETGAPVSVTVAQTTSTSTHRIELLCERGHLHIDLADAGVPPLQGGSKLSPRLARLLARLAAVTPRELLHNPYREPSFRIALEAFVSAARENKQTSPDLEDGFEALEVVLMAVKGRTLQK